MDSTSAPQAVPVDLDESQPSRSLGEQGRTNSRGKALVYNPDHNTLEVKSKKKMTQGEQRNIHYQRRRSRFDGDLKNYSELHIPRYQKRVVVYVDKVTESRPTTSKVTDNGERNIFLMTLYLGHLSILNSVLRILGRIESLYILNQDEDYSGWSSEGSVR